MTSRAWFARLAVAAVFTMNAGCAVSFMVSPARYSAGFELEGVAGETMVRGLGILFLMWNVTYPPVIVRPERFRTLYTAVLVQQAIGVAGESWLWLELPKGHGSLAATGLRFIVFDGVGMAVMAVAYALMFWFPRRREAAGRV